MQVDWQRILFDLRTQFMPLASVARLVDVHPKTLQKIARNGCGDVMYQTGIKLMELHKRYVVKEKQILPTKR